jgi:hypothetical protein
MQRSAPSAIAHRSLYEYRPPDGQERVSYGNIPRIKLKDSPREDDASGL